MRIVFIFISLFIIENELVAFPSQSVNDVENFIFSIVSTANCSSEVSPKIRTVKILNFVKKNELWQKEENLQVDLKLK